MQYVKSCQQLRHSKWLYEVVIGTTVQPLHSVVHFAQSTQYNHWCVIPTLA